MLYSEFSKEAANIVNSKLFYDSSREARTACKKLLRSLDDNEQPITYEQVLERARKMLQEQEAKYNIKSKFYRNKEGHMVFVRGSDKNID